MTEQQQIGYPALGGDLSVSADNWGGETVVTVTNLNDSGEGSLRWALEDLDMPRTVVFDVGGTIELKDDIAINGDVTVEGQTAPGGVAVTGGHLQADGGEVTIHDIDVSGDADSASLESGSTAGDISSSNQIIAETLDSAGLASDDYSLETASSDGGARTSLSASAVQTMSATAMSAGAMPAFEGAQGFGADADGGRGGKIVKVTNLNDSGEGSLRWALEDLDGPRIVVFEVGGEIKLNDQIEINGDVTVAGQTAPGGITVSGGRLRVVDSDVIIRGMHIRPGDGPGQEGGNRDGISVGKDGHTVENVIIDSNSISWSVDELASAWAGASGITFSNNILAEALENSIHNEGAHSMGLLVGDGSSQVSIVGNLFAHNMYRNPTVKDDAKQIEVVNNVVYNYGPNGFMGSEGITAHLIGNVYIPGQDSASRSPIRLLSPESGTAYYLGDNIGDAEGPGLDYVKNGYVFTPATTDVLPSSQVLDHVLANVGARAPELDAVDQKIIQSVKNGTGSVIDSPDEVGGYTSTGGLRALPDGDDDGIPDEYEQIIGSDKARFDAHGDADGDGYSNIEDYINGLLDGFGSGAPVPTVPDEEPTTEDPTVPTEPESPTNPGSGAPIRLEAEALTLTSGFRVESNGHASGGKLISAKGDGTAELTFDGPTGTYDVTVEYFDETDGVSTLSLQVNGVTVDSWNWDQSLGSAKANSTTATSYTIQDVAIGQGDEVVLAGSGDGREPLRIDAVELVGVADGSGSDLTGDAGGSATGPAAPIVVEAESMELVSGFKADAAAYASGGQLIRAKGDGLAQADIVFDGPSGVYDFAVNHFDETDGVSRLSVMVNGVTVGQWDWDKQLGSNLANSNTATTTLIEDVVIAQGDVVTLAGYSDGSEPLRIDSVEFVSDYLVA